MKDINWFGASFFVLIIGVVIGEIIKALHS